MRTGEPEPFRTGDMIVPSSTFSQVHPSSRGLFEVGLILEAMVGGYKVLFHDGEVCHISTDYAQVCYRKVELRPIEVRCRRDIPE